MTRQMFGYQEAHHNDPVRPLCHPHPHRQAWTKMLIQTKKKRKNPETQMEITFVLV